MTLDILYVLEVVLKERQELKPADSYSAHLFSCGLPRILDKLGEEVVELIVAARHRREKDIIHEAADAVFHLLVFMVYTRIRAEDVLPAERSLSDARLDGMVNDYRKDDDSFFFTAPLDSLGKIIFLSNEDLNDHDRYENICLGCRQLFYCILMLCAFFHIRVVKVMDELKSRIGKTPTLDEQAWIKH